MGRRAKARRSDHIDGFGSVFIVGFGLGSSDGFNQANWGGHCVHAFRSVRSMAMAKQVDISDSPQLKPLRMCDTCDSKPPPEWNSNRTKKAHSSCRCHCLLFFALVLVLAWAWLWMGA
tara:strand:- start:748 stop:1101 length:354 start_codon:yes stop_codon:yes gene_type:complete